MTNTTNDQTLTKAIYDCSTNELMIVPLTEDEIVAYKKASDEVEAQRLQEEAKIQALNSLKASAKAKLMAGEPLTEEEANTLII